MCSEDSEREETNMPPPKKIGEVSAQTERTRKSREKAKLEKAEDAKKIKKQSDEIEALNEKVADLESRICEMEHLREQNGALVQQNCSLVEEIQWWKSAALGARDQQVCAHQEGFMHAPPWEEHVSENHYGGGEISASEVDDHSTRATGDPRVSESESSYTATISTSREKSHMEDMPENYLEDQENIENQNIGDFVFDQYLHSEEPEVEGRSKRPAPTDCDQSQLPKKRFHQLEQQGNENAAFDQMENSFSTTVNEDDNQSPLWNNPLWRAQQEICESTEVTGQGPPTEYVTAGRTDTTPIAAPMFPSSGYGSNCRSSPSVELVECTPMKSGTIHNQPEVQQLEQKPYADSACDQVQNPIPNVVHYGPRQEIPTDVVANKPNVNEGNTVCRPLANSTRPATAHPIIASPVFLSPGYGNNRRSTPSEEFVQNVPMRNGTPIQRQPTVSEAINPPINSSVQGPTAHLPFEIITRLTDDIIISKGVPCRVSPIPFTVTQSTTNRTVFITDSYHPPGSSACPTVVCFPPPPPPQ